MKTLTCLCLAVLAVTTARAEFYPDIEYGTAGNVSLKLDIHTPVGRGPFPAVILVHGGGWTGGDKAMNVRPLFEPLDKAGFAWVSVNYRLAPLYRYPACVEDVEASVRWVKAHARDYHLDADRIALCGESAGGQLVDMVAVRATPETRVAAVVSFYAPCDLVADTEAHGSLSHSMMALFNLTAYDAAARRTLDQASALRYVSASLPPFLLIHGTADTIVPYKQSVAWQSRLKSVGVACDLITVPNGKHAMGNWEKIQPGYKDEVVTWLTQRLTSSGTVATTTVPIGRTLTSAVRPTGGAQSRIN
jgi:acetyl esterase